MGCQTGGGVPSLPLLNTVTDCGIMKPVSRELPSGTVTFVFTNTEGSTKGPYRLPLRHELTWARLPR
jgi:hypothetical protein